MKGHQCKKEALIGEYNHAEAIACCFTKEQLIGTVFWKINQLYPWCIRMISLFGLCNNKDIILILGYNYNLKKFNIVHNINVIINAVIIVKIIPTDITFDHNIDSFIMTILIIKNHFAVGKRW